VREHISVQYDAELDAIRAHLFEMAGKVELQLQDATRALLHLDMARADAAIAADAEVNQLEMTIDDLCNHIIVRRQPTAGDLRFIMATVKMIGDLERIGDESSRIAKMAIDLSGRERLTEHFGELDDMAANVTLMLRNALHAYIRVDMATAAEVIGQDKAVDASYRTLMALLLPRMEQGGSVVRPLVNLMWSARALERIGDHAKNVAEYVIYLGRGLDIRHQPLEAKRRDALGEGE